MEIQIMDKFNASTGIAAVAGASLVAERGHNAWARRQKLTLKQNSQILQKQQIKIDREAAAQQRAIDHQNWLIRKSEESRKIYSAYNNNDLTVK
jgi:hypothetical protein